MERAENFFIQVTSIDNVISEVTSKHYVLHWNRSAGPHFQLNVTLP